MTPLEAGTTFAGKYLIDGVLGKGGMGAVYSATNQAIGRRVAIKVLVADLSDREDVKRRFALEARAAAVINHPGIVDVLDMGETPDGEPFIVMEHLEGATLKAVLKKHGIFSPGEAVGVIAPLLEALAAAHQANVIHRDIKPANVFLCTRPQRLVKLLDFGISRFGQSTGLTHTGTAVGTPKYMSPEQVMGERTLGPAADLYSVGAVLYELLGGRAPYDAGSDIATLAKLLKEEHDPLATVRPELPPRLCAFVDGLLVKDAAQRPSDAGRVKEQLVALARPTNLSSLYELAHEVGSRANTGGTPRPPSGPGKATPSPRRQSVTKLPVQRDEPEPVGEDVPPPRPSGRRSAPKPSSGSKRSSTALEPVDEVAPPPPKTPLVIAGVVAVVGVLVGAGLFIALGRSGSAEAGVEAADPAQVADAVPAGSAKGPAINVVVKLSAEPANTRFEVDGQKLEGNPLVLTRAKDTGVAVVASAPGHEPQTLQVVFSETREERLSLTPRVADATPTPTPKPARPPRAPKAGAPPKKGGSLTVDETNPYE
ncbi:MAG: protein kinase [Myxococcaceae bacterium]|nr:protein kinase [Myxococcaceae bacterium]